MSGGRSGERQKSPKFSDKSLTLVDSKLVVHILKINLQLLQGNVKWTITLLKASQLEDDKHESLMIMIPCVVFLCTSVVRWALIS